MKTLIASDIHGSALYCKLIIDAVEREQADRLLLLGDILYHGPRNDLPEEYSPKAVISMLNALPCPVLSVRGNCDAEVEQMVLNFPTQADYTLILLEDCTVFVTHGHKYSIDNPPPMAMGDILLQGHTHVACKTLSDGFFCFNPGSASMPKENSPRGYMTLEKGEFLWKTLDGEIYDRFVC